MTVMTQSMSAFVNKQST